MRSTWTNILQNYNKADREMTVVIGLIASRNLIFASDGFAIYQDDTDSPTFKFDTHNKIKLVGNGKYLLGSAGAHHIDFEISSSLEKEDFKGLSEKQFLEHFAGQVRKLNLREEGKRTSFILGYFDNRLPKLFLFQHDGEVEEQYGVVALGSGADLAIDYLNPYYNNCWETREAVSHVISAIFEASKIPTVNFLPMISILTETGFLDLSNKAVSMFHSFKDDLKRVFVDSV